MHISFNRGRLTSQTVYHVFGRVIDVSGDGTTGNVHDQSPIAAALIRHLYVVLL